MRFYAFFLYSLPLRFAGFCLLFLAIAHTSPAQDTVLKAGTDTTLIKNLIEAGRNQHDPDSSLAAFKRPLQLSIAGNYTKGTLLIFRLIAYEWYLKTDYMQCVETYKKALPYCRKPAQRATLLHSMGNIYSQQGDFIKASENFYAALGELQNTRVMDNEAVNTSIDIYTSLAILNTDLQHDSSVLYYLTKGEELARKEKAYYPLTTLLLNKSTYYQHHKKFDSAILVLQETQSICKQNNFKGREADIDENLGGLYVLSGHFEDAIRYFKAGRELTASPASEQHNYILTYSAYGISEALYRLKRYKEAENMLVPALKRAAGLNIQSSRTEATTTLINIYKATRQYKKALEASEQLAVMKDSLTGTETATAVNQIEVKYKTAEKDKQLSQNQLQLSQNQLMIAKQNNKIARKNIWVLATGGTLVVLLLIAAVLYLQSRNKQRSLEKENKIGILRAAVAGGDSERSRIARELHDGIGGMLSAAMMRFSSMHHEEPAITQTAAYKEAMGILREMGDEIRKTAHNLMPEVLLKQSLPEAVQQFCTNVQEEGRVKINFQSYGSFDALSQSYKLNLYRITQELVKNAMMHAKADRVLVQLLQNEDKLIVSVDDNGIGFDEKEKSGGLGLYNIRTRVSSMDGHFTLESKPGKGTTVIIELGYAPLPV